MRYFLILLFVCVLAFSASYNGPAYSQRHTGYCDQAASTADALDCVNRHNKDTQEILSTVFKEIIDGQEGEVKAKLSEAQKNWIIYRDAQCQWEAGLSETPSLRRVYELSCLTDMTERRIKLLESVKMREEEKAPREFGTQPRWMNALAHDYPDIYWRYGEWQSADLNCDEEDEQIMAGLSVARVQDAVTVKEDSVEEKNHNEVSIVIAVSDNPQTGRPKSKLFRLPVSDKKEGAEPHVCSPAIRIEKMERVIMKPESAEQAEGEDVAEAEEEQPEFCAAALLVTDRICDAHTLYWDGKEFVLETDNPKGDAL